MVVAKKHKKIIKRGLYIGLFIVALFWLCYGLVYYWNNTYIKTLSNNSEVLVEVAVMVDSLEDINIIEPSKTSGYLPGVATSYKEAGESAGADRLSSVNVFTAGLHAIKKEVKTINKAAAEALEDTSYRAQVAADGLIVTQKFIEYTPAVDLEPYKSGEETDASERLSRTQEGIQGVIKAVEESKLPYRKDIIDTLKPLEKKATAVTPQTVDSWAAEVLEAQNRILVIIKADYENNIGASTQMLRDLSGQYLQLR